MYRIFILFLACCYLGPASAFAHTYYVSNTGDDTDTGTSPAHAWRTTARVSAAHFQPGDKILLAGGQLFEGGIWVRGNSQGTAREPIVFRSYGSGKATIQSGDRGGFYAQNTAGIELRNLAFVGSGRLRNESSGVLFYLDSADTHLQHLRFDSLEVSGYRDTGICIGSWNGLSGYSNVRITNCQVHDNGDTGLSSYAFAPMAASAHHNWYIGNCLAYNNSGRTDVTTTSTGSGIVMSGIDGVLVEKCLAHHNGWLNGNTSGGPVGIWGYACNNLVIQQCESHHNSSGTGIDGGGFDLDGGCTNSVLQYNYSHDNGGPGYLLAQYLDATPMHDLTVRYNISENDAQSIGQGALAVWSSGASGGIVRANFYNNTVYLSRPASGSTPKAVYVMSGGIADITFRNNLLQTSDGLPLLTSGTTDGLRLEGNCYWSTGAPLMLNWGGTTYATLDAWRAATGQETVDAGARPTGLCADPRLYAAGAASATAGAGNALARYNLSSSSALVGAGLNLAAEFSIDPGTHDFFGNPTPALGSRGNIGASEARGVLAAARPTATSAAWCQIYPTVVHREIHVAISQLGTHAVQLQLFDLLGRQCWSGSLTNVQPGATDNTLDLKEVAAGHYILHVQSGTQVLQQSLIVAAN